MPRNIQTKGSRIAPPIKTGRSTWSATKITGTHELGRPNREFIDENGGGHGVRLRKQHQKKS